MWKTASGGVCTLVHAVALHEGAYDAEIVIIADGWKMRLVDPYGTPKLAVRRPGVEREEVTVYEGDDPFYSEIGAMVDVLEGRVEEGEGVLSSFGDALRTYELVSGAGLGSTIRGRFTDSRSRHQRWVEEGRRGTAS